MYGRTGLTQDDGGELLELRRFFLRRARAEKAPEAVVRKHRLECGERLRLHLRVAQRDLHSGRAPQYATHHMSHTSRHVTSHMPYHVTSYTVRQATSHTVRHAMSRTSRRTVRRVTHITLHRYVNTSHMRVVEFQGQRLAVCGSGLLGSGLGFGVPGLGFRIQGLGFRV